MLIFRTFETHNRTISSSVEGKAMDGDPTLDFQDFIYISGYVEQLFW